MVSFIISGMVSKAWHVLWDILHDEYLGKMYYSLVFVSILHVTLDFLLISQSILNRSTGNKPENFAKNFAYLTL